MNHPSQQAERTWANQDLAEAMLAHLRGVEPRGRAAVYVGCRVARHATIELRSYCKVPIGDAVAFALEDRSNAPGEGRDALTLWNLLADHRTRWRWASGCPSWRWRGRLLGADRGKWLHWATQVFNGPPGALDRS